MSKTITTNVRTGEQMGMIHLFEFDMNTLAGVYDETLRFTDHDLFVYDGTNEYTPLSITFDRLSEDFTMASDSINVQIDNINESLTNEAFTSEWRNNRAKIQRVILMPPSESVDGQTYNFGISDNTTTSYPRLEISGITKDTYTLFEGVIDTFSATAQTFTAQLTTKFTYWQKPYPSRTYNQNEFSSVVSAISDSIYWGRQKST